MVNNRILLINPPLYKNSEAIASAYMMNNNAFNYPPLGLLSLAANLPTKYETKIIDAPTLKYSPNDCIKKIRQFEPFLVGLTVFTDNLYSCSEISKKIKQYNKKIIVVFGGPHVTIYPEKTLLLGTIDYALSGFCENTFSQLVQALELTAENLQKELPSIPGLWRKNKNNVIIKPEIEKDTAWNINNIKSPNRKLLDITKYFTAANKKTIATMVTSVGCPFRCVFCDVLEKRILTKNISVMISEIKEILNLGIQQINFFDDCFNLQRTRVIEFCHEILNNKLNFEWSFRGRLEPCDEELSKLLYKAGCRRAQIGIEATDQKTIDIIRKDIDITKIPKILDIYKRNNIQTMGYFIIGFPHQTYEDCVNSCKQMIKMRFDYINLFVLVPYPNTEIYKELLKKGFLQKDYWEEHIKNPKPNFRLPKWHPFVTKKELIKLAHRYHKRFYFSPRFILAELKREKNLSTILKITALAV